MNEREREFAEFIQNLTGSILAILKNQGGMHGYGLWQNPRIQRNYGSHSIYGGSVTRHWIYRILYDLRNNGQAISHVEKRGKQSRIVYTLTQQGIELAENIAIDRFIKFIFAKK